MVQLLEEYAGVVCRRLAAVGMFVVSARAPLVRAPAVRQRPLRERLKDIGTAAGHRTAFNAQGSTGGIRCLTCGQHGRLREATLWLGWLMLPCPGPGVMQGHELASINGLLFCKCCGRHGGGQGRALRQACQGEATEHGQRVLRRLAARPPLPPYRLAVWPDGSAVVPGTLASRKKAGRATVAPRTAQAPRPQAAGLPGRAAKGAKRPVPPGGALFAPLVPPRGAGMGAASSESASPAMVRLAALRARVLAKEAANRAMK